MKKLFRRLTQTSSSANDANQSSASSGNRDPRKSTGASNQLAGLESEMQNYRGQKYNPAEDDQITTESIFNIIDGDTGKRIDVRELLGVTEEEFAADPELQAALAHMNKIKPIDSKPQVIEEEKKEEDGSRIMDQKSRHFKYFEMLDTLPVTATQQAEQDRQAQQQEQNDHVLELNAEGATANVIAWDDWWQMKERTNQQLFQAIGDLNEQQVRRLLEENPVQQNMLADVNTKDERNQTPLHSSIFSGDVAISKLLLDKYAEINAADQDGKTPLHLACMLGNLAMVRLLLSRPECIATLQDNKGYTALHIACDTLNDAIIRFLKESDRIELSTVDINNRTARDVLNQKAKQAGQLTRFIELIDAMDPAQDTRNKEAGIADGNQPQDMNLLKIYDADENEAAKTLKKGRVSLDSFEVIEPLGKGSFGCVYLVSKKGEEPRQFYAMKILEKDKVLSQNLVRYARTERNVLSLANHQFIVGLNFAFQSESRLYLIMDYAPGGDMGMALANHRRFTVDLARVYAAEIVLALEYLHKQNIIFRDLKPDNVVFDEQGHAMLTDFGLSKTGVGSQDVSQSFCGSVAYLAPEMLRRTGHSRSIDWYLLGVLIYEMLVGVPPYFNTSKTKLFENIQQGPLKIPHTMPHDARQIILLLLNRNPQKRLGAQHDAEEVKQHEFFSAINWDEVAAKKCEVHPPTIRPIKPDSKSLREFIKQEKESRERFADFERTNLCGPKAASRATVENWSFVRPADDRTRP